MSPPATCASSGIDAQRQAADGMHRSQSGRTGWMTADLALRGGARGSGFYSILSSLGRLDLPGWAVLATGAGAEPSA